MRKVLITFCLLGNYFLIAQTPVIIDQELPNVYKKYYKITDVQKGKAFDNSSSSNIYGNTYHGGTNQRWLIMPLVPGQDEVVFASMHDGKVFDRHHGNNLYGGNFHGGSNQKFAVSRKYGTSNKYIIFANNGYALDRSNSSLKKDPFSHPSSYENNLYANSPTYATNQQFQFTEVENITASVNMQIQKSDLTLDPFPNPMSASDVGDQNAKYAIKLVGRTILPYFLVNDSYAYSSPAFQAQNSPYYVLERYRYYKIVAIKYLGNYTTGDYSISSTVGVTSSNGQQIKNTLSVTQSISGSVNYDINSDISTTVGYSMSETLETETVETTSTTVETTLALSDNFNKTIPEAQIFWILRFTDEYRLYRMNSTNPILTWENVADDGSIFICSSTPSVFLDETSKSTQLNLVQNSPINRIPQMTSDYTPYGSAYCSSKYSSSYGAYKALDNASNWTNWISKNTGTYSPQYLEYRFEEPVVIRSYNVTPQTGNLANRAPNRFSLQGWNGFYWVSLDYRTGKDQNFWNTKASRDFNIKNPKKYSRYRIYVYAVNGSSILSLRSFKLYGPESVSYNKNGLIAKNNVDNHINQDNNDLYDLSINPNPVSNSEFIVDVSAKNNVSPNAIIDDTCKFSNNIENIITTDDTYELSIYNVQGNLVHKQVSNYKEIKVTHKLEKGIYIVRVNVGSAIVDKKFIVN